MGTEGQASNWVGAEGVVLDGEVRGRRQREASYSLWAHRRDAHDAEGVGVLGAINGIGHAVTVVVFVASVCILGTVAFRANDWALSEASSVLDIVFVSGGIIVVVCCY